MNPLAPYLLWIKAGLAAAVLVALGFLAWTVHGWHRDAQQLEAVRRDMAALQAAQAASQKASEGLQNELEELRSSRKPAPPVRVCKPAKPVPQAGAGRDDPATGAGELPKEAGPDIGADLYGLADDADELAARLRACQALLK
jgi:hypothetical protein